MRIFLTNFQAGVFAGVALVAGLLSAFAVVDDPVVPEARNYAWAPAESVNGKSGESRDNALLYYQHDWLGTDETMEGPIEFEPEEAEGSLVVRFTWASALDYINWMQRWQNEPVPMDAQLFSDGLPNYLRYALYRYPVDEWAWDFGSPFPEITGSETREVSFLRASNDWLMTREFEPLRVNWWLERRAGDETWQRVEPEKEDIVSGADMDRRLPLAFEQVIWTVNTSGDIRVVMRVEPKPALFAHYMPGLWPGDGAILHHMSSEPALVSMVPGDYTKGILHPDAKGQYQDYPLIRPGVAFTSPEESAEMQIRRAMRTGVDGFAIDMWGGAGPEETFGPLFRAARKIYEEEKAADPENAEPFQIAVVPDWSTLPQPFKRETVDDPDSRRSLDGRRLRFWDCAFSARNESGRCISFHPDGTCFDELDPEELDARQFALIDSMRDSAADAIAEWLSYIGKNGGAYEKHIAHRGGMPMVMGYASYEWVDAYLGFQHQAVQACNSREMMNAMDPNHDDYDPEKVPNNSCDEGPGGNCVIEWKFGNKGIDAGRLSRQAFQDIEDKVNARLSARNQSEVEIFWQFDMGNFFYPEGNQPPEIYAEAAADIGRYFPAVNQFLPLVDHEDRVDSVRQAITQGGAEWGEPINLQYVHRPRRSPTYLFLTSWYAAIGKYPEGVGAEVAGGSSRVNPGERSSLIQMTTWNDYGEWTHIEPGLNSRYVPMELVRYFSSIWKTGRQPDYKNDPVYRRAKGPVGAIVMLLHRKYNWEDSDEFFPFTGNQPRHPDDKAGNAISVLVIFPDEVEEDEEVEVMVDGRIPSTRVPGGSSFFVLETLENGENSRVFEAGDVSVTVTGRGDGNGEDAITVVSPSPITVHPFREDRSLVGISNVFDGNWEREMAWDFVAEAYAETGAEPFRYAEYGDSDGDGLPNWFKRFFFGRGFFDFEAEHILFKPEHVSRFLVDLESRRNPLGSGAYNEGWRLGADDRASINATDFDLGGPFFGYTKRDNFHEVDASDEPYRYDHPDLQYRHGTFVEIKESGGGHVLAGLRNNEAFSYSGYVDPSIIRREQDICVGIDLTGSGTPGGDFQIGWRQPRRAYQWQSLSATVGRTAWACGFDPTNGAQGDPPGGEYQVTVHLQSRTGNPEIDTIHLVSGGCPDCPDT